MTVMLGLVTTYLFIGLAFWLCVMIHGGFRKPDGSQAPLLPDLRIMVLKWPAIVSRMKPYDPNDRPPPCA